MRVHARKSTDFHRCWHIILCRLVVLPESQKQRSYKMGLVCITIIMVRLLKQVVKSSFVLENEQSELTALEKGKHAYQHIQMVGEGKGGVRAGISEYARQHNLPQSTAQTWYTAYRVIANLSDSDRFIGLSVYILYEISKIGKEEAWQPLCNSALEREWTVEQIRERVKWVKKLYSTIPKWWKLTMPPVVSQCFTLGWHCVGIELTQ